MSCLGYFRRFEERSQKEDRKERGEGEGGEVSLGTILFFYFYFYFYFNEWAIFISSAIEWRFYYRLN